MASSRLELCEKLFGRRDWFSEKVFKTRDSRSDTKARLVPGRVGLTRVGRPAGRLGFRKEPNRRNPKAMPVRDLMATRYPAAAKQTIALLGSLRPGMGRLGRPGFCGRPGLPHPIMRRKPPAGVDSQTPVPRWKEGWTRWMRSSWLRESREKGLKPGQLLALEVWPRLGRLGEKARNFHGPGGGDKEETGFKKTGEPEK